MPTMRTPADQILADLIWGKDEENQDVQPFDTCLRCGSIMHTREQQQAHFDDLWRCRNALP